MEYNYESRTQSLVVPGTWMEKPLQRNLEPASNWYEYIKVTKHQNHCEGLGD